MVTKLCKMTHTDSLNHTCSLNINLLKLQASRRPPFWKKLNHYKSATFHRITMTFSTMMHFNPLKATRLKIWFLKNQDGKRPMPGHDSKQLSNVENKYGANADGMHIGAIWWIQINCPCAVALRPAQTKIYVHTYIHTNLYSAKIVERIWGAGIGWLGGKSGLEEMRL